ncbi:hypothetical protein [Streptomyces iconiensis]|uniref:Peptidase inhibitor family I36 n=1 Tax=Streptomyces iconiensis TaxID=1384038 RepID=A0ABT7A431_9ACTN|nr:hypothetical protein [Streptomyces iconiensis]MDJ1136056.1 hypothetical protein [Streptomyces iconiensis]
MKSIIRLVVRAALTTALGATAVIGGSSMASASDVQVTDWSNKCNYGRACIYKNSSEVWNVEKCGFNPIHDYYGWAKAHGNTFVVTYQNGLQDRVPAWTERGLDPNNLVTSVDVFC